MNTQSGVSPEGYTARERPKGPAMLEQTDNTNLTTLMVQFNADLFAQPTTPRKQAKLEGTLDALTADLVKLAGVRSCSITVNTMTVTFNETIVNEDSVKDHIDATIGRYASDRKPMILPTHQGRPVYTTATTRRGSM